MSLRSPSPRFATAAGLAWVALAGACLLLLTLAAAPGRQGFPLDDPWIHLQFARNLAEHGRFSYWQDAQVTSGSTAPLFTLLLAAGLAAGADPYLLAYGLGALCLVAAGLLAWRLGRGLVADLGAGPLAARGAALAAGLLVVAEPRLLWAALSGMETTLFTALLLAALVCRREGRTAGLGLAVGLLLWTRPEAVIMVGALAADAVHERFVRRPPAPAGDRPWRAAAVAGGFAAAYAAFNLVLSGSLLPNTYSAKLTYYAGGGRGFGGAVLRFLLEGAGPVVLPLALAGAAATVLAVARRRPAPLLVPLLWCLGLTVAYWWKLPYLYQHGRYLMPLLPFLVLLAVGGLEALLRAAAGRRAVPAVRGLVLAGAVALALAGAWRDRGVFGADCAYITARQVATARWIDANLPADAVVATHDVGALAWASGRRIVDMVGLVSPEVIADLGDFARVEAYLRRQGVTHVAVLRSWYLLDNVTPVFRTDPDRPEVMEVFPFVPGRLHLVGDEAWRLAAAAERELAAGNPARAEAAYARAVAADPDAASLRFAHGRMLMVGGRTREAAAEFAAAVRLQPDLWDARYALADIAVREGDPERAIVLLEELVRGNPAYADALAALAQLHRDVRHDPEAAAAWLRRWREAQAAADAR